LTVSEVSAAIRIRQEYITALESGHYTVLPSGIYIRNFLKEYATFLGVSWKRVLALYEKEMRAFAQHIEKGKYFAKQVPSLRAVVIPKLFRIGLLSTLIFVVFLYISFSVYTTFAPPRLIVSEPFDNLIVQEYVLQVTGSTDAESQVMINGQSVPVQMNGVFEQRVSLHDGLNTIVITAHNKHSRTQTVSRQVVVEPSS
jgi:cytoskeletal protein RodZ